MTVTRLKVATSTKSRQAVLEGLPEWTAPIMGALQLPIPELSVIFPNGVRTIRSDVRAGWIDVRIDDRRVRVAFQFTGHWNWDLLRNLKMQRLAHLVMRALHPALMRAKYEDKALQYFVIKGLVFEHKVGLGTDYINY